MVISDTIHLQHPPRLIGQAGRKLPVWPFNDGPCLMFGPIALNIRRPPLCEAHELGWAFAFCSFRNKLIAPRKSSMFFSPLNDLSVKHGEIKYAK
jgi:hypothetical protein